MDMTPMTIEPRRVSAMFLTPGRPASIVYAPKRIVLDPDALEAQRYGLRIVRNEEGADEATPSLCGTIPTFVARVS